MVIRIDCPSCAAELQVGAVELFRLSVCPECGTALDDLVAARAQHHATGRTLAEATPHEMIEELARRQKCAVLVHFNRPKSGSYKLDDLRTSDLQCVRTGEIRDEQLYDVLESLGKFAEIKRRGGNAPQLVKPPEPFSFKGDRLGLSLTEFCHQHARQVKGCSQAVPWCSDASPDQRIEALLVEPWHTDAGIVHARINLPFEDAPTIAGVKTEMVLYQFVDERLYRISAFFETGGFPTVADTMIQKYGTATVEKQNPRQLIWSNALSSIVLTIGCLRPKKPSTVHFVHTALSQMAEQRRPNLTEDI